MCHCSTEVFPTQNSPCWFNGACASSTCEVWEGDRNIDCTAEQKAKLFPQSNWSRTAGEAASFPLKTNYAKLGLQILGSEKPALKNCLWEGLTELKWQLDKIRKHWKLFLPLPGTQWCVWIAPDLDLQPLRTHNPAPGLSFTEFSAPDAMEMSKFGFFRTASSCSRLSGRVAANQRKCWVWQDTMYQLWQGLPDSWTGSKSEKSCRATHNVALNIHK